MCNRKKQCIVQSAWRFQMNIEKVKSELSWNRSLHDWFEASSHFAQVQTFPLHAASPTWKTPKCWEWLCVYYASLLPYALQHQTAPFQTLLTGALLVRSSFRAWVAFWASSQIWKTGQLFKYYWIKMEIMILWKGTFTLQEMRLHFWNLKRITM